MKKLKDLLNETINPQLGKVYSDPYAKSFVKENEDEESSEMTTEQKHAFLEAVKAYKSFGETVYRNEGLSEVYESIRGLVEVAGKNMVKETEGSFDGITVSRHVKRMNESFKIFEKTLREVATLQQRLESSYDEIGETLGKYYEINETDDSEIEEGNEFGAARAKAIANGDSEFEVDGKTYKVTNVDKEDKENAEKFASESLKEFNYPQSKMSNVFNLHFAQLTDKLPGMFYIVGRDVYHNDKKIVSLTGMDSVKSAVAKVKKKLGIKESMKLTDMLKEGKDVGHYERVGNQTIVDSNFVNYSKGVLPNSELVHLGMGDFAIKSKSGTIKFQRSGKMDGIGQDFVGRPHRMTDDKNGKLVDLFLKLMLKKKKAIISMSESTVNEGMAGWIAIDHKGNKLEIKKSEAKDLYNAKLLAIKKLKVPKSKVGMLAIKPAVDESVVNEAKYDIGMARKGNGLTIYNKAEEENGDYKNVAHIDNKGKVKYLDKKVPSNIKKEIEAEAKKMIEITNEGNTMIKLKDLMNESFGFGELPSSKLMKMKVSAKDMLASVGSNNINESEEDESANEDVYVKNKKTGNTYAVKNADPSKHEPPSEKEISKAKADAKDEPQRGSVSKPKSFDDGDPTYSGQTTKARDNAERGTSDAEDEPVRDDNTDMQIADMKDELKRMNPKDVSDYAESDIFPYLKGKDLKTAETLVSDIAKLHHIRDIEEITPLKKKLSKLFDDRMTLESVNETKKRFKKLANIIKG